MFVCSISELRPAKLLTEEKRQHMTPANVKAYNKALTESKLLNSNESIQLVDAHSITAGELTSIHNSH